MSRKENTPLYKLIVLGDGGVGKTALTIQLCLNHFIETYDPTIEDSYRKKIVLEGEPSILEVLDTAGQEEYTALRDQWIREGEGFILVYSITSRSSFTRIRSFYNQILRAKEESLTNNSGNNSGNGDDGNVDTNPLSIVIVGNKSDRGVDEREVSTQEGEALARELGNAPFFESSAKFNINIEKAFLTCATRCKRMREASVAGGSGTGPQGNNSNTNSGSGNGSGSNQQGQGQGQQGFNGQGQQQGQQQQLFNNNGGQATSQPMQQQAQQQQVKNNNSSGGHSHERRKGNGSGGKKQKKDKKCVVM